MLAKIRGSNGGGRPALELYLKHLRFAPDNTRNMDITDLLIMPVQRCPRYKVCLHSTHNTITPILTNCGAVAVGSDDEDDQEGRRGLQEDERGHSDVRQDESLPQPELARCRKPSDRHLHPPALRSQRGSYHSYITIILFLFHSD